MLRLLSIAGSDPSGGAGIQMDIKTFTALGAYGMAVPTSITVQNTCGVKEVYPLSRELVIAQVEAVLEDIPPHGIKIGMLAETGLAETLAGILDNTDAKVVFDPVLKSTTGQPLTRGAMEPVVLLAKRCTVITPNREEAIRLTGAPNLDEAVLGLRELGISAVITGGDAGEKEVEEIIIEKGDVLRTRHKKLPIPRGTHGTGCCFSSALTYFLALGLKLKEACEKASEFVASALERADVVGKGIVPAMPERIAADAERFEVIERLKLALENLRETPGIHRLIPEVQSNLGEALREAKGVEDVAAFPGRIVRLKETVATVSPPEFGASSHVARIILTAKRLNPQIKACMNVKYKREWIELLKESGSFNISSFSRAEEPVRIKEREGSTLDWGTEVAIKAARTFPNIIYDEGDVGKEPMIRVLGKDALDVVEKVRKIAEIVL